MFFVFLVFQKTSGEEISSRHPLKSMILLVLLPQRNKKSVKTNFNCGISLENIHKMPVNTNIGNYFNYKRFC